MVFGGTKGDDEVLNDTWAFSVTTRTWREIVGGVPPCGRMDAMGVYDVPRKRLVVFGGRAGALQFGDTWALDLKVGGAWTPLFPTNPQCEPACEGCEMPNARSNGTAAFFQIPDKYDAMVIHGGVVDGDPVDDPWLLDLSGAEPSWQAMAALGGPAREGHSAVASQDLSGIVYFGGRKDPDLTNETHVLQYLGDNEWTWEETGGVHPPSPREGHAALGWSPTSNLLAFGGATAGGPANDLWELSFDITPPAGITDFIGEIAGCGSCSGSPFFMVEVGWTGVGDDGMEGRACVYEVRFSPTGPVSNGNPGALAAPPIIQEGGPGEPMGTTAGQCGYAISPYSRIWLAVRARDEGGTWGPFSPNLFYSRACCGGRFCGGQGDEVLDLRVKQASAAQFELELVFGDNLEGQSFDLAIYDIAGRRAGAIAGGLAAAGVRTERWNLENSGVGLGRGVYFVRLKCGSKSVKRTMVIGK